MSKMSEAQYELMQDCKDKKITARSARHTRTHCGKRGSVKLPSDYLSAKERKKLNGECKSYRMNDPMTWGEFKLMPDDLKVCYIKALRQKYNVPDNALCEMFGVEASTVSKYLQHLGLSLGKNGRARVWDEKGFVDWWRGVKTTEVTGYPTTKKEIEDIEKGHTPPTKEDLKKFMDDADATETAKFPHGGVFDIPRLVVPPYVAPSNGTLTFEDDIRSVLRSLTDILRDAGKVRLTVQWSTVDENVGLPPMKLDTDSLAKAGKIIDYAVMNEQRKKALGTKG